MKKAISSLIASLFLVVFLFQPVAVSTAYAYAAEAPTFKDISVASYADVTVPNIQQEKSQWCWAAVSSSVLQYYKLNVTQQQVAVFVKGGPINEPASNYDIVRALNYFGLNAVSYNGVPSYSVVQQQINNGNSMINLINWQSGGGHFQVLDGYYRNNGRNYIKIMDPWYGDHYNYSYDYYKSNSKFWWHLYIESFSK